MPHVDKRKTERKATLREDEGDEDSDAEDDKAFFNINIDALLARRVTFNFDPQTSAIQPTTWKFVKQTDELAGQRDTAVPKQSSEQSTVQWNFNPQTKLNGSDNGWKFQKVMEKDSAVRWAFDDQCPKSSTISWDFPNSMSDTRKIQWRFNDQIDGIAPPAWQFAHQTSDQSTVPWGFGQQVPKESSIPWGFSPQTPVKGSGKWKFPRQMPPASDIPWNFDSQLAGTTVPIWKFEHQLSDEKYIHWGFTTQSGLETDIAWKFQACLGKDIHGEQLDWGFEQCLASTNTPIAWPFTSQIAEMRPVTWDNMPHMTDSLDAGVSHSFEEIAGENLAFKEHYLHGCQKKERSKVEPVARGATRGGVLTGIFGRRAPANA